MTTSHFWEVESNETYRAKQADDWANRARKDGLEYVVQNLNRAGGGDDDASPMSPTNFFGRHMLKKADVDAIEKPVEGQKSSGLIKTFDRITSPLFAGKVRQPWDVLRPVQRVLEAEQKYIARPLARMALSPLPGKYEDLPGIVRMGTEVLFDPLTYVGPGSIMTAARAGSKMSQSVRLGAPMMEGLFSAPGSRRAVINMMKNAGVGLGAVGGGMVAEETGVSPLIGSVVGGIVAGGSMRNLGKQTQADFTPPEHFEPVAYDQVGLSSRYEPSGVAEAERRSSGRLYPGLIRFQRGDTILKAERDNDFPNVYELSLNRVGVYDYYGKNPKGANVKNLMDLLPILDDLVENNPNAKFRANPSDPRRARIYEAIGFDEDPYNGSWQNLNKERFKAISSRLMHNQPEGMVAGIKAGDEPLSDLEKQLQESMHMLEGDPDAARGAFGANAKLAEMDSRADDALARQPHKDTGHLKKTVKAMTKRMAGGAPEPEELVELIKRVATAPVDLFGVKSVEEVLATADAKKNTMVKARQLGAEHLPPSVTEWFRSHGMRFRDTEITAFVNEHKRAVALGPNYAAHTGDEIRGLLNKANSDGTLVTREVPNKGTVITDPDLIQQAHALRVDHEDLHLVDAMGHLYLDDLVNHSELFNLTDAQRNTVNYLITPMENHRAFERLFGIEANEEFAHRQILKTPVEGYIPEETMDISTGPVVAGRFGAKQPFQRPRSSASHAAGVDNGNTYLPYIESQAARVAQGYNSMADAWINKALSSMNVELQGKKAKDLIPAEMVDDFNLTKKEWGQVRDLKKNIITAERVGRNRGGLNVFQTPSWAPEAAPDIQNVIAIASMATQTKGLAARSKEFARARELLDLAETNAQKRWNDIKAQKKSLIDEVSLAKDSEARAKYPIEFHGRYYPMDAGTQLQELDAARTPEGMFKLVNEMNDQIRPIMATLDLSFLGVQGLVAAFSNPSAYIKAAKIVLTSGYGDYEAALFRSGRGQKMLNAGMHWAARNDFAEFIFGSAITKLPKIGPLADVSNSMFTQFGNVLRSEMFKTAYRADMDPIATSQLARTVNLVSGFSPNSPGSTEKAMMFAPRFFRSQMGLVADSFTKHDLSPAGAANKMALFLTTGTLFTYLANESLGNETDFDPSSPNFMRIRVGDQDMSLFGTWDSLARVMIHTAEDGPIEGAKYLARTKASPVVGKMYDLISGETLNGQQIAWGSPGEIISSAASLGTGMLPMSAQNLITEPPDPRNPTDMFASGVQFLGTKSTPLAPSERRAIERDRKSHETYDKSWEELEPFQQENLRQQFGLTGPATSEIGKAFEFRRAISERYQVQQEKLDAELPIGRDWIEARADLRKQQVGAYAQWAEEHPDALASIRHSKPKDANQAARQQYYSIFDQADKEDWSQDELSMRMDDFQDSLTQGQQDYIDRNSGLKDTPRTKQYKAASKVLRPYWDLGDQVYERLRTRLPQGSQSTNLQDYTNDLIMRLQDQGVPDQVIMRRVQQNPVIREIDRATSVLRERYRARHPEVDRELVRWYGYKPIR